MVQRSETPRHPGPIAPGGGGVTDDVDLFAANAAAQQARADRLFDLLGRAGKALIGLVRNGLIEPIKERRERRQRYDVLISLDDYVLKDIGLTRAELPFVARHGGDPRVAANVNGPREAA